MQTIRTILIALFLFGITSFFLCTQERSLSNLPKHMRSARFVDNFEYSYWDYPNRNGMRGNLPGLLSSDEHTVFMIGDSFTYSVGTAEQSSIPFLLQQLLSEGASCPFSVYNLGKNGADLEQYLEIAQRFHQYQPDIVVLGLYMDNDVLQDLESPLLQQRASIPPDTERGTDDCPAEEATNVAVLSRNLPEELENEMCQLRMNIHLLRHALVGGNHLYYRHLAESFSRGYKTKNSILAIRDAFPGSHFVLLLFPSKYQVSTRYFDPMRALGFHFSEETTVGRDIQDALLAWAHNESISVIDLLPALHAVDTEKAPLFYRYDDHMNEAGNLAAAAVLRKELGQFSLCD